MAKGSETGGCLNCYAARLAARNMPGMRSPTTGEPFARMLGSGPRWTGRVELIPSALDWPTLRLGALAAAHRSEQLEAVSHIDGEEDRMLTCPPWRRAAVLEREARLREAGRREAA